MLGEIHGQLGGPPAGFWRRFAAALIDGVLLSVVNGVLRAALGLRVGPGAALGLALSAGYFMYFHGRTGQTPGNAALGIRVVDERERLGKPIGYGRAFVRWLVSIPSAFIILLGYLWMLWDPRKQTWHDKAAGSLPVHVGY